MLSLGRKVGESIIINGNVKVTVTSVNRHSGQIKLAFVAPNDVTIDREEIHQRKQNN